MPAPLLLLKSSGVARVLPHFEMPPRPDPRRVRVTSREDKGEHLLERFEFENGVDMTVPGILLIPKNLKGPAPTIVALHGHGSSKESICTVTTNSQYVGPVLAAKGFVVASIDAYFNGERIGKGPAGQVDDKAAQEASLFKPESIDSTVGTETSAAWFTPKPATSTCRK